MKYIIAADGADRTDKCVAALGMRHVRMIISLHTCVFAQSVRAATQVTFEGPLGHSRSRMVTKIYPGLDLHAIFVAKSVKFKSR